MADPLSFLNKPRDVNLCLASRLLRGRWQQNPAARTPSAAGADRAAQVLRWAIFCSLIDSCQRFPVKRWSLFLFVAPGPRKIARFAQGALQRPAKPLALSGLGTANPPPRNDARLFRVPLHR